MPLFFADKFCDCLRGLPVVEAAGDMAPMTSDNPLRKHRHQLKRGKNYGSNNPFSK